MHSHFEWAPGRKIDPAGESDYATGAAMWDMDTFRVDVAALLTPTPEPTPEPPQEDTDMLHIVVVDAAGNPTRGPALVGPGYWHYARNDDQAFVWQKVYGPPYSWTTTTTSATPWSAPPVPNPTTVSASRHGRMNRAGRRRLGGGLGADRCALIVGAVLATVATLHLARTILGIRKPSDKEQPHDR